MRCSDEGGKGYQGSGKKEKEEGQTNDLETTKEGGREERKEVEEDMKVKERDKEEEKDLKREREGKEKGEKRKVVRSTGNVGI